MDDIDREILNSVLKVENIHYQDELFKLINKHLTDKGDDYDFTKNCFQTLWTSNFNEDYPLTLKDLEALLQQFFPTYREHFIHQLQVFLLGAIILSHLFKNHKNFLDTSEIDDEIRSIIDSSYLEAKEVLTQNKDNLERVAKRLLEKEVLETEEFKKIISEKSFISLPQVLLTL